MPASPPLTEDREPLPLGLVLFPPGSSARHRRRRVAFLAVYLVLVAALVWPVYPYFSGVLPLILGLPLSLAWVVIVLVAGFGALLALYLSEDDDARSAGRPTAAAGKR